MEQGVNEVQGCLARLKENIAELQSSFEETVKKQAKKLASREIRKLRKKFRAEREELLLEYKREKSETEGLIRDIFTHVRQCLCEVRSEKDEHIKSVILEEKENNRIELETVISEARDVTTEELNCCSEAQLVERFGLNLDIVSTGTPKCATCGQEREWLSFCGACKVTQYCDEKCQSSDWEQHKNTCIGLNYSL